MSIQILATAELGEVARTETLGDAAEMAGKGGSTAADLDELTGTETLGDARKTAGKVGSTAPGWLKAYCRTVGVVQLVYAGFFGYVAYGELRFGQFYHPASHGKGDFPAYYDYEWLVRTPILVLISATGFLGGVGLLGLRRRVRGWEIAYLAVLFAYIAEISVEQYFHVPRRPGDFYELAVFIAAVALPFVPFVFGLVGSEAGATRRFMAGRKNAVIDHGGVGDRRWMGERMGIGDPRRRFTHCLINKLGVRTVSIRTLSRSRTKALKAAGSLSAASRMTGAHLKTRRTASIARMSF